MKEAVTIFFFANNNHLSNVRTLQSIYRQDYPHINLVVCNDCTYGFQSERLLNNFEAGRGANIEYIYYQENPIPMGECGSQLQLWDRIDTEYYFVIHSGDLLSSPDALRLSINSLRLDRSLAAVVNGLNLKDEAFNKVLSTTTITRNPQAQGIYSAADKNELRAHRVRDCMAVYRLKMLKKLPRETLEDNRYLGKQALPALLEEGHRIAVRTTALCCYSESSIQDVVIPEPTKLGRDTLRNIRDMLQEQAEKPEDMLFQSQVPQPPAPRRNRHRVLYKLSSLKKILRYAGVAVLLAIAAGLFLQLEAPLAFLGWGFLALAACAGAFAVAMLVCNLYYKKNPQRLVNQ